MTTQHSDSRPILERIKNIVPGINDAVELVQGEHDVAKRLLKLMVLMHANLVEMGETLNQALLNSTDLAMAQETLVSDQKSSMKTLEDLADQTAGARTVIQNLDIWIRSDAASIQHFLEIVDLIKLAEAARELPAERLAEIIVTLQGAGNPVE